MSNSNNIKCPQCGHEFPADEAFLKQAEARIKTQYEEQASEQNQKFAEEKIALQKEKKEIEHQKNKQDKALKELLEKEKIKLQEDAQKNARNEFEQRIEAMQEENEKRRAENKELKKKEITLLVKEKELTEQQEDLKLQMEKNILERQKEIEDKARAKERESFELERMKLLKQIDDNKKLAEEMKRKADQGSMQMQGEVLELALAEFLRAEYPFDMIEEVSKGERGADVIQTVRNNSGHVCGKIIYESKRTKTFVADWISKLKNDQREKKADLAVIVTEIMPKDMYRFGNKDNVWICTFPEAKGLSFVLREMLIRTHAVGTAEENKTDKMALLYSYLTGPEFSQRVEAIVEGFSDMKSGIDKEKRAMQKIWKAREMQIEKVTNNTIDMYGSIKGIAGNAIGTVKALELPEPE